MAFFFLLVKNLKMAEGMSMAELWEKGRECPCVYMFA